MDIPIWLTIGLTIFFSTITIRLIGFGGSLVAMPFFATIIGIQNAAPLMTMFNTVNFSVTMVQFWRDLTLQDVWRLTLTAVLFIPIGVASITFAPEDALRILLGVFTIGFAIYRAINLPMPKFRHPRWAYLFGAIAGFVGGAINLSGLPTVVYAETQEWEVDRFRINMFSFFFVASIVSLISRFVAGQFTAPLTAHWLRGLPFLLAGHAVGHFLTRYVNRDLFRKIVLSVLVVMGCRILWSVFRGA